MGYFPRFFRFYIFVIFALNSVTGFAVEQNTLHSGDVKKVMEQMLSQHVRDKEVTAEILRTSFKVYVDQFDPERIYLLESEVLPFYTTSDAEMKRILRQYKRDDFSAYEQLNDVIVKAINRAQEYRQVLMNKPDNYKEALKKISMDENGSDQRRFSTGLSELQERQKREMFGFIQTQIDRYGEGVIGSKQKAIFELYDKNMKAVESQYLSTALPAAQWENLLTMHIIKALAKSLDAHSSFYTPNEAYDMRVRLEKGFDGIGLVLRKDGEGYKVIQFIENSPASKSDLVKLNDTLLKIDGVSINALSLDEVMKMLRGQSGSQVSLLLARGDKNSQINVVMKRAPIVINEGRVDTSYAVFGDGIIGTIKLHSFYQGKNGISSEKDVEAAIADLSKKGKLKGLILDLRDNSGGFLTQAVKVAGLFITNGVIVVSKYSNGEERFYRDMDGKVSYTGPMLVLTSRATASAAEIVAQALQDYGVALVVGDEQTYGKGTIQSQTVTGEGSATSYFKVTVGKYYTVSGKTPQIQGVKADIVVPSPYSLEQIGEEYVDFPVTGDVIASSFDDRLNDIDPGLRPWYLRYYTPTLQKPANTWINHLSSLKKNSQHRLSHNAKYREYLEGGRFDGEHDYGNASGPIVFKGDDPQHHEALNIVKDMIIYDEESQNNRRLGITNASEISEKYR